MKRYVLLKAALLFAMLWSPLTSSSQGALIAVPSGKEVLSDSGKLECLDGRLSVALDGVPLTSILSTLKKRCHLHGMLDESLVNETVSTRFTDLPLPEGLKRLLRPYSYVVIERAGLIEQVFVFARGQPDTNREYNPVQHKGPLEREEERVPVPAESPPEAPPLNEEIIPPYRSEEPGSPPDNPEEVTPPVLAPGEGEPEGELPSRARE